MQLRESALIILNQLNGVVSQLKAGEYETSLELLSDNSIGKHVRHVLEFFDLLLHSKNQESINYDTRKHDLLIETSKNTCLKKIDELTSALKEIKEDRTIDLEVSYSTHSEKPIAVHTSINRELAYNIEHAIHHMAIIKIAINTVFPHVTLPEGFGVAYSTIRYQKTEN